MKVKRKVISSYTITLNDEEVTTLKQIIEEYRGNVLDRLPEGSSAKLHNFTASVQHKLNYPEVVDVEEEE